MLTCDEARALAQKAALSEDEEAALYCHIIRCADCLRWEEEVLHLTGAAQPWGQGCRRSRWMN